MIKSILKPIVLLIPPIKRLKQKLNFYQNCIKDRNVIWPYLQGQGIEIGALHSPFQVPSSATVTYVDRMTVTQLRKQYPELNEQELIEPDILDDGETLLRVTENSQDFVIACHMIEHAQNPISALENFLRVCKPNGIIFLAVPDKRYCFDRDRPVTPISHLIKDYEQGPEWSKYSHYKEWVELVEKCTEEEASQKIQQLMEIDYSIHFHVWTSSDFEELLLYCQKKLNFPFEVEFLKKNRQGNELLVILKKFN